MSWLRPLLSLLGAVVLIAGSACGGEELGSSCERDEDCQTDLCAQAPGFAALGKHQCLEWCSDGCPSGSVCVDGVACLPSCQEGDYSCPSGSVCDPFYGACFAACSDSSECGNNTCSARMLCDGE